MPSHHGNSSISMVTLKSGLRLPNLSSVRKIVIDTELGREMTAEDIIGLLTYAQQSQTLKELRLKSCLLPQSTAFVLPVMRDVEVTWQLPQYDSPTYTYDFHAQKWRVSPTGRSSSPFEKMKELLATSLKESEVIDLQEAFHLTKSRKGEPRSVEQLLLTLEEREILSPSSIAKLSDVLQQLDLSAAHSITQNYMSRFSGALHVGATITKDGGLLQIPNTGVSMSIPAGALEEDCFIQMRIVPNGYLPDSIPLFSRNTTAVVELLPNNIKLSLPVLLNLSHCAQLKEGADVKVTVLDSHHDEGTKPKWVERQDTAYKLGKKSCSLWLKTFTWVTYIIGSEQIEAKELVVFAGVDVNNSTDALTDIEVGYYHNLAGMKESVPGLDELQIIRKTVFMFRKEGSIPLQVLFNERRSVEAHNVDENPKMFDFLDVLLHKWNSTYFFFKTDTGDDCTCRFEFSQGRLEKPLGLNLKAAHDAARRQRQMPQGGGAQGRVSDEIGSRLMQEISRKTGPGWKFVGRSLGLKDAQLHGLKEKEDYEFERVYGMLSLWKSKNGINATREKLIEAYRENERQDIVDIIESWGKEPQ